MKEQANDANHTQMDVIPVETTPTVTSSTLDGKDDATKQNQPEVVSYWSLFRAADKWDTVLMLFGTIGALGAGALMPIFAVLFGRFTDAFGNPAGPNFLEKVYSIALSFLYLAIAAIFASYFEASFWMLTGNRQTNRLRRMFLSSVLSQDVAFFDKEATTGGLVQGLNEDSLAVQKAISEKVGNFQHHASTFICGFIVAFTLGWDMTLVMLACVPFLAIIGMILANITTKLTQDAQTAYQDASSLAQQSIAQVRTVASYHQEESTVSKYETALQTPLRVGIRQSLLTGVSLGMVQFVMYGTYALSLFYGATRVAAGAYTGGTVMSVMVAALLGGFSLGQAAPNLQHFSKGKVAGYRLFKVIDRMPSQTSGDKTLVHVDGALELRGVSFCYPARPDVQVLHGFSLQIPAGKTVALVGSSGSGKSTIIQLIERFYDPSEGTVLLDGTDLRTLQLTWLRNTVGLVSQEPTLFATTIFENILMGKPGASKEQVQEAAVAANAHRFISSLPLGYETQVGERGLQLSGGQKQRIAIARAILKNPKVLLLDEATSALDTASERIVQDALDKMVIGRTTVVVAHRLSTIRNADVIAVVRQGQVVEQGTHGQLLKDPVGVYTNLVKLQMQKETEKDPAAVSDPDLDLVSLTGDNKGGHVVPKRTSLEGSIHSGINSVVDALKRVSVGRRSSLDGHNHTQSQPAKHATTDKANDIEDALLFSESVKTNDSDKKNTPPPAKVPLSRLLNMNRPEWGWGLMGTVSSIIAGAISPAFSYVISSMVVIFYLPDTSKVRSGASFYAWMFFVIGCCSLVAITLQQYGYGQMGQHLAQRIRMKLFHSIMHQDIGWFDEEGNSSGSLTSILATDATYVRGAVGDVFGLLFQNLTTFILGYILALVFDWRMALVVTGVLPLLMLAMYMDVKFATGLSSNASEVYASANQGVAEAFSSIRVIQAYNLQERIGQMYHSMQDKADKVVVRQSHLVGVALGFSYFMMYAIYSLVIFFAGHEIKNGWTTFEGMLNAYLAILLAAMGMAEASVGFPDIGKASAAIQRVFPIIDRQSKIDSSCKDGMALENVLGVVEFQHVRFAYPTRPSAIIFEDFNLCVPAGKTVALVGESGSGKSSVISLLERFYDPLAGTITLDGIDIQKLNITFLRSQMALVSQEPMLFGGSVLENICYGRPTASMDEVERAARAANAHDFITALPEGYNTKVGEGGIQLSGGQKQRVAIARAVIKNPRILLLDEATSALDAQSEKVVQEALEIAMVGRTTVVIAHRLATIRNADTIAVVYHGTILEQGSHDELLMLPNGNYSRLVAAQERKH